MLVACIGLMLAATAEARTLRYATGFPPGSVAAQAAMDYAEALPGYSDDTLSMKVYALSLLDASETSDGVRDGIADVGYLLTVYFPSMYPHTNLVNESSMQLTQFDEAQLQGKGALAFNAAMAEFTFFNCPECLDEYAAQNQVYTGNAASSDYGLLCNKPVTNEAQLAGKRLRVAGSHWSRWSKHFGATPVSMTINDLLEALSQGVLDCTISSAPELVNLRLTEAVTDITMAVPGGVYAAASAASVNGDVWRELTDDQRRAMLRAGARLSAAVPYGYLEKEKDALAAAEEEGAARHEAAASLEQASAAFAEQDLDTIVTYYRENHGVERGEALLATFRDLLEKWVKRVGDVDSLDALEQLYWDEIFSKVDVSSYGMQ